jgi:processive 1,2-diacylglycerol beta-glucosyltransferase|tara:strand:+ start:473 stop:1621 length:1149 start_codon:yes stop_codon:yes gene_type:complete
MILTSSTGSGHDVRSYALKDWAEKCLGDRVEVEVWHALEESSVVGRFGVWIYNTIQRHLPALHFIFWHITEVWGWVQDFGTPFGGGAVEKRFKASRPHLVISMHDSLNAPYFARARAALGADQVRCAIYCGEWSPGFGFSKHWIDPSVDLFLCRTKAVAELAVERGISPAKCHVFRALLRPTDFESRMAWDERKRYRSEVLNLDSATFTLLLASGMKGADRHEKMLDSIADLGGKVQVIALCGKNETTLTRTRAWAAGHPDFRISIHGFLTEVGPLFQSSDIVLTRGGSNTLAECVHFVVPALFHAERGPMPQEFCTSRFLHREGIGLRIRSARELKQALAGLLEDPDSYDGMIKRMGAFAAAEHPETLVERLYALGKEVVE